MKYAQTDGYVLCGLPDHAIELHNWWNSYVLTWNQANFGQGPTKNHSQST